MVYGNNNSGYTEDYLANRTPVNVIPSYATIDEMAFYVIESSEIDFNNIMMETGIEELQHFEATGDVLTESDNFIDKAEKWFYKTWDKAQDMIRQAEKTIADRSADFRNTVFRKIDKKFIKDKADRLSATKDFGSSYDFKNIDDYNKYLDEIKSIEQGMFGDYKKALTSYRENGAKGTEVAEFGDKIDRAFEDGVKKMTNQNETSISSVVKSIKDHLRGNVKDWKGVDVKEKHQEMLDEVINYPRTKRTLKNAYGKLKQGFNQNIREIKKSKDTKDESIFSKALKGIKNCRQLSIAVEQALISVINERYSFYRSILIRLIASKKVKESASLSSTSDAIDSLFDW